MIKRIDGIDFRIEVESALVVSGMVLRITCLRTGCTIRCFLNPEDTIEEANDFLSKAARNMWVEGWKKKVKFSKTRQWFDDRRLTRAAKGFKEDAPA